MKIYISHYRVPEWDKFPHPVCDLRKMGEMSRVKPNEGITLARIYDDKGNLISTGMAICGKRDNYNKKIGREIAIGRAQKALKETATLKTTEAS